MVVKGSPDDCNCLREEINPGNQEISRDSLYFEMYTSRHKGKNSYRPGHRCASTEIPVTAVVTLLSAGLSSKNAIIASDIVMIILQQLAVFFCRDSRVHFQLAAVVVYQAQNWKS
jgi:hypothetical protein